MGVTLHVKLSLGAFCQILLMQSLLYSVVSGSSCEEQLPGRNCIQIDGTCRCVIDDMILSMEQASKFEDEKTLTIGGRGAKNALELRWPKSDDGFVYVPYERTAEFEAQPDHVAAFDISILTLKALTCVRVVPANGSIAEHANRLQLVYEQQQQYGESVGCSSYVGKIGGSQAVTLGSSCGWHSGVVMHELLHALGFYHEQNRPDRDDYITMNWDNIDPDRHVNFLKYDDVDSFGSEYDVKSIMHYSASSFSINGKPTMYLNGTTTTPKVQQITYSEMDLEQIRSMYSCGSVRGVNETSDCMNTADYGRSYIGNVNVTSGSHPCKKWNDTYYTPSLFTGIDLSGNNCRNPTMDPDGPWCFIEGSTYFKQNCSIHVCGEPGSQSPQTVTAGWTPWSSWSECSESCGVDGTTARVRECIGDEVYSDVCPDSYWEEISCNNFTCPSTTTTMTPAPTSTSAGTAFYSTPIFYSPTVTPFSTASTTSQSTTSFSSATTSKSSVIERVKITITLNLKKDWNVNYAKKTSTSYKNLKKDVIFAVNYLFKESGGKNIKISSIKVTRVLVASQENAMSRNGNSSDSKKRWKVMAKLNCWISTSLKSEELKSEVDRLVRLSDKDWLKSLEILSVVMVIKSRLPDNNPPQDDTESMQFRLKIQLHLGKSWNSSLEMESSAEHKFYKDKVTEVIKEAFKDAGAKIKDENGQLKVTFRRLEVNSTVDILSECIVIVVTKDSDRELIRKVSSSIQSMENSPLMKELNVLRHKTRVNERWKLSNGVPKHIKSRLKWRMKLSLKREKWSDDLLDTASSAYKTLKRKVSDACTDIITKSSDSSKVEEIKSVSFKRKSATARKARSTDDDLKTDDVLADVVTEVETLQSEDMLASSINEVLESGESTFATELGVDGNVEYEAEDTVEVLEDNLDEIEDEENDEDDLPPPDENGLAVYGMGDENEESSTTANNAGNKPKGMLNGKTILWICLSIGGVVVFAA